MLYLLTTQEWYIFAFTNFLKFTWQNRLDAIENERDGEQRAEICHRVWNYLTLCEQVADVVAKAEDHNGKDDRDYRR